MILIFLRDGLVEAVLKTLYRLSFCKIIVWKVELFNISMLNFAILLEKRKVNISLQINNC